MATFLLVIALGGAVLVGLMIVALAGFRNGDFTGEALARALRQDLEAGGEDRVPPF